MRKDNANENSISNEQEERNSQKKQLTMRIFLLVVALVVVVVATFAWLVTNKKNDASGISAQIDVTPNMVISKSATEITSMRASNASFVVTFTDGDQVIVPTRHNSAYTASNQVQLEYNTNPTAVDIKTGLKKSTEGTADLAFDPVLTTMNGATGTDGSTHTYYHDYDVYIASVDKAMTGQDLTATISTDTVLTNKDYLKACSVDFYVYSEDTATYIGTLNLAGYDWSINNFTTKLESLKLYTGDIPLNTSGSIHIKMRLYFDGGLKSGSGKTFINSADVLTDNVSLKVSFVATDKAS